MRILIDADGCPVVDSTLKIAKQNGFPVVILCDTSHIINRDGATTEIVDKGADSVDFALVGMIKAGDIAVTQDYGLAAMCLARGAYALSQNGMIYDGSNIDGLLMRRHLTKKIKASGGRVKGPSKRTGEQDEMFERALKKLIENK